MANRMKCYHIKFKGHNPIGAVAVVVAPSRPRALRAFVEALPEELREQNERLSTADLIEFQPGVAQVIILNDGDY